MPSITVINHRYHRYVIFFALCPYRPTTAPWGPQARRCPAAGLGEELMAIENEAALEDRDWIRKKLRPWRRRASLGSSHIPPSMAPKSSSANPQLLQGGIQGGLCVALRWLWPRRRCRHRRLRRAPRRLLQSFVLLAGHPLPLRRFGTPTWRMPRRCLTESPARGRRPVDGGFPSATSGVDLASALVQEKHQAWIQKKGLGRQAKYWNLGPQGTGTEKRASHSNVLGSLNCLVGVQGSRP
jgi:hypothetical protein